jgi:hypothetical protein
MQRIAIGYKYVIIVVVLCAIGAKSERDDRFPVNLEEWYSTIPPEINSAEWITAHHDSDHEWDVYQDNLKTKVRLCKHQQDNLDEIPNEIRRSVENEGLTGILKSMKVDDGWIVSSDRGEFAGGGQWWFSFNGKTNYKISDLCVVNFHVTTNGLIGIQPQHSYKGSLICCVKSHKGIWEIDPIIDFNGYPLISTLLSDGSIIVVADDRLIKISQDYKNISILLTDMFWTGLYPNSIVYGDNATIYIGMRHGVAMIQKNDNSYNVKWLMPSKKIADIIENIEGFK